MKPIRLQVQMPTIGMFSIKGRSAVGEVEQLTETMVFALRRSEHKGALSEDFVRVLAFVPEQFRAHLREKGRLIGGERVWCVARVAENKKSLAPFMASGDREWKEEEATMAETVAESPAREVIRTVLAEMFTVAAGPADVDNGFGAFTVDNCIQVFGWKHRIENALRQMEKA